MSDEVRAAGCIVWRRSGDSIEVLIIHRPGYDDWSFPKGKLEKGEAWADAAVREVEEETGLVGLLGPELERSRYVDHKGRSKTVRWWSMEVTVGSDAPAFVANDEVDSVRWCSPDEAGALLTYPSDAALFGRAHGDGVIR